MTNLAGQLDTYALRARLYPALLVVLPAALTVLLLWPGFSLEKLLVPVVITAGTPFLIINLVRSRGKRLEQRLTVAWDGLPTTRMLRLRNEMNNPDLLQRRRQKLQALIEQPLPTRSEEDANPQRSDQRYEAATRTLIARVRDQHDHYPRLHEENIHYGFRRNLLALKPSAITLLLALLAVDGAAAALGRPLQPVGISAAVHLLCLAIWLIAVRSNWVREQGQSYAERLFETLEEAPRYR